MKKFIITGCILIALGIGVAGASSSESNNAKSEPTAKTEHIAKSAKKAAKKGPQKGDAAYVVRAIKMGRVKIGMTKSQVKAVTGTPESADNSSYDVMGDTTTMTIWSWTQFTTGDSVTLTFQDGVLDGKNVSKF